MVTVLLLLWRVGVPLVGLTLEALCVMGIISLVQQNPAPGLEVDLWWLVALIIAAMILIILFVLLIEGQFYITYRVALPAFMGTLAICLFLALIAILQEPAEIEGSPVFGSMRFYTSMFFVGAFLIIESLWLALTFVIQGLPEIALGCIITGGVLLLIGLLITFVYWIVMMLVYFFAHYYQIFFIVFGSAMGGIYLIFLISYFVVKHKTIASIVNDNLDKYWRTVA